jgi:ABC-type thiamine transport system ATPase subunit
MLYSLYLALWRDDNFMAIYNLDGLLDKYSGEFLILEFNHLFVSSSIREEVWLLQRKNDSQLIDNIMQSAREFNIHDIREDRDFETYSGGQKAIIACLLTLALIRDRKINGLKLLLNNILDSISEENRSKLLQLFKEICPPRDIGLFTEKNGNIQEIN